MSDIKFDGEYVVVEGNWTKLRTLDLMLDAPSRRKVATGYRRALVHDPNDGLTINYANDYPGGVTINGAVKLTGTLTVGTTNVGTTIASLLTKVAQLEAKVAALEAKVR